MKRNVLCYNFVAIQLIHITCYVGGHCTDCLKVKALSPTVYDLVVEPLLRSEPGPH
jgi:hypothetical protein